MDLIRLGDACFEKQEDAVHQDEKRGKIGVIFRNFGHGTERTSDYTVELSWQDVENVIFEFARMNEHKALYLQEARKLAEAAERAGWTPNSN
jgi:hypothetical protein